MKTSRLSQRFASLAIVAFLICGQQALAQDNGRPRFNRITVPRQKSAGNTHQAQTAAAPNLYSLQASFIADYPVIGANADGTDLWPCLDLYQGGPGSSPDCPTLGDPSIPFPLGALVSGYSAYTWPLKNAAGAGNGFGCDALVNGTTGPLAVQYNPCGQIFTSFEDDTGDFADDLLQRIVVRQGASVIYDSGTVDYGPAGPSVNYPVVVFLNYDTNFGFWPGASTGPNNGNCSGSSDYPLASPANPGKVYVVESGKTCREPVSGLTTFTTTTVLATPAYTKVTGTACTARAVASPCYTVKWTKNHEIWQNWNIFLD
ncbi:MAG: hypothetical protein ABSD75_27195 [Terriglobales bacterium]|jgi:hypothetical protein